MDYQKGQIQPVDSFQRGFEFIKNDYWQIFLFGLVSALVIGVVALGMNFVTSRVAILIGTTIAGGSSTSTSGTSAIFITQGIALGLGIFTGVITTTLGGILVCGIFDGLFRKERGEQISFSDFFAGFNYFGACFSYAIILSLVNLVVGFISLGLGIALGVTAATTGILNSRGEFNPNVLASILGAGLLIIALSIVFTLIIGSLTIFVYPLIVDRKLGAFQAISLSASSALANIGSIILFIIVQFLITLVGVLLCGVGIFFVIPIIYAGLFVAYRSVFPSNAQPYSNMPPPPPNFGNQGGYQSGY